MINLLPNQDSVTLGTKGPFNLFAHRIPLATLFNTHLYICGRSKVGKSSFMRHLFTELVTKACPNGRQTPRYSVVVMDPHTDLANDCLASLYTHQNHLPDGLTSVLYIDPTRTDYLLPLNVLINSYSTPHQTAEDLVTAFKRTYPDIGDAPLLSEVLRDTVQILAELRLSIVDVIPFLTNKNLRSQLLAQSRDVLVQNFFYTQFNRWGRDQLLRAASTLNKVSAFIFTPEVRFSLGAATNLLDWRRIADAGRIVIVDLGGLSEESQILLGNLLVIQLEKAAKSRRNTPIHERKPVLCMIDEFVSFMSKNQETVARLLSEIRKFRCHMALCHQTNSQLTSGRLQGALENADLKIIFSSGKQTAEAISEEIYFPDTSRIKHQITDAAQRERTHPYYESLLEQKTNMVTQIRKLAPRRILVQPTSSAPLIPLRTPTVPDKSISTKALENLKHYFARRDGIPYAKISREVNARLMAIPQPKHTKPVYFHR